MADHRSCAVSVSLMSCSVLSLYLTVIRYFCVSLAFLSLSVQMCVQFDRSGRGKSDSLCGLEEVLSTLQPSVFVDEQLSKYKVDIH